MKTFDELHRAIKRGDIKSIETALDEGADVNLCNANGANLLMLAAGTGNTVVGNLLIARGADIDARTHYREGTFQDSPLTTAAISGKSSFVELLLEHGALLTSPFPGTFEIYLDWLEKHSACSPEQIANMRSLIKKERAKRAV